MQNSGQNPSQGDSKVSSFFRIPSTPRDGDSKIMTEICTCRSPVMVIFTPKAMKVIPINAAIRKNSELIVNYIHNKSMKNSE